MIVVFGSINVDLVTEMAVVPKAGQTVIGEAFRMEAGGKGANQALAARRAGAEVIMAGAIGRDQLAAIALGQLVADGVDTSNVCTVDGMTGIATIWIEQGGANRIVVAAGANAKASAAGVHDALIARASSVLLQMEISVVDTVAMIRRCRDKGTRAILNLAPAIRMERGALSACGLLVVNEDEAAAVGQWFGVESTAAALHRALGCDVIRTLGEAGAEAATQKGQWHTPAHSITTVDTTAAGDCFVGVLAAALDRGRCLQDAMSEASAAAALACTVKGSQASLPARAAIDGILARR